jgi:hypothetical protein
MSFKPRVRRVIDARVAHRDPKRGALDAPS